LPAAIGFSRMRFESHSRKPGGRLTKKAGKLWEGVYCHPVSGYMLGKFGTVALNQTRAESWKGAFVVKAVGGYGYSGWIWETVNGAFRIKQGPKLLSLETSEDNGR
jgi:hypothetical protein